MILRCPNGQAREYPQVYRFQEVALEVNYWRSRLLLGIFATARPALLEDHPHCEELGSIVEDLNLYTLHVHPLFAQDNANLYDRIERELTGTSYSSAIILFRCARNGKSAMDAVISQFSGNAVWELRIK